MFERENLDESKGAANIIKMTDELDNKEHSYLYNDDNKLIEYGYVETDGSTFNIKKTSENTTEIRYKNDVDYSSDYILTTNINKDEQKLLSPRISDDGTKLANQLYGNTNSYSYDNLGRIKSKVSNLYSEWQKINGEVSGQNNYNITKEIEYKLGSQVIKKINSISSHYDSNSQETNIYYEFENNLNYSLKNDLMNNNMKVTSNNGNVKEYNTGYEYNKASQLLKETFNYIDMANETDNITSIIEYTYNNDGSLNTVMKNEELQEYNYSNGRLSSIIKNVINLPITYDNLGNTLTFDGNTYNYIRGNLLSSYTKNLLTTNYYYNGQGKKFKKVLSNGITVKYTYDNEKLISETHSDGKELIYLYDVNGIYGFSISYGLTEKTSGKYYYFVKASNGIILEKKILKKKTDSKKKDKSSSKKKKNKNE